MHTWNWCTRVGASSGRTDVLTHCPSDYTAGGVQYAALLTKGWGPVWHFWRNKCLIHLLTHTVRTCVTYCQPPVTQHAAAQSRCIIICVHVKHKFLNGQQTSLHQCYENNRCGLHLYGFLTTWPTNNKNWTPVLYDDTLRHLCGRPQTASINLVSDFVSKV
jgi:hypothetical protein